MEGETSVEGQSGGGRCSCIARYAACVRVRACARVCARPGGGAPVSFVSCMPARPPLGGSPVPLSSSPRFITIFLRGSDSVFDFRTLRAVKVLRPLRLVSGIPSTYQRQQRAHLSTYLYIQPSLCSRLHTPLHKY